VTRLRAILSDADIDLIVLCFGLVSFLWGVALLLEKNTFESNPASFAAMARIAPEYVWGIGILAFGLSAWTALLAKKWQLLAWISLMDGLLWAFVATMFYVANPNTTAPFAYVPMALFDFLVFLRLRRRVAPHG